VVVLKELARASWSHMVTGGNMCGGYCSTGGGAYWAGGGRPDKNGPPRVPNLPGPPKLARVPPTDPATSVCCCWTGPGGKGGDGHRARMRQAVVGQDQTGRATCVLSWSTDYTEMARPFFLGPMKELASVEEHGTMAKVRSLMYIPVSQSWTSPPQENRLGNGTHVSETLVEAT
jgi:hypothetical protein